MCKMDKSEKFQRNPITSESTFLLFVFQILWDENIVPTEYYSSEGTLREFVSFFFHSCCCICLLLNVSYFM